MRWIVTIRRVDGIVRMTTTADRRDRAIANILAVEDELTAADIVDVSPAPGQRRRFPRPR